MKEPFESPTPTNLIIKNLIFGAVLLIVYFEIMPKVLKTISKISLASAEKIGKQFFLITIGYFIFIFFINLYLWEIRGEEQQIKRHLEINPNDFIAQKKLKQIKRRKDRSIAMLGPISTIIFGVIIGFIVYTIFTPIYNLGGL